MREWRDLWPGGLDAKGYSTLNLMAQCRRGPLGWNVACCGGCGDVQWHPASCGDRHCPNCLGQRQARWSEAVCERMPDCPHFHVVFTVPRELHAFFELNYRLAAEELFAGAAGTLKSFQRNNHGIEGGFLGVLHTWGRSLNWHPHLHVLVSAGGRDVRTGRWRRTRSRYLARVQAMSKVYRAAMLRGLEEIDGDRRVRWPEGLETIEARRDWRLRLARRSWNIYSRPTLGNTRAVVRYLARYTSRIAMSNQRIRQVDPESRTVRFEWKDHRDGGKTKETTMGGAGFIRALSRHLVPEGFRRIRSYGLLAGAGGGWRSLPGAPGSPLGEKAPAPTDPPCPKCGGTDWKRIRIAVGPMPDLHPFLMALPPSKPIANQRLGSYSLVPAPEPARSG